MEAPLAGVMPRSGWRIKTDNASNKRADFNKICSICLQDSPETGDSTLVAPCLCSGFRSYQHKGCIEDWIERSGVVSCPFCQVVYNSTKSKKGFFCYIKECGLERDFLLNLAVSLYGLYLFLVGLSVCYTYSFSTYGCDSDEIQAIASDLKLFNSINWKNWPDLARVLECRLSMEKFEDLHSWPSILLFCLTCIGTILLMFGVISLCLNMTFRHYIKYILWSRTNYRASIKPYKLVAMQKQIGRNMGATDRGENERF